MVRGGLWTISFCLLLMSPALVYRAWWWSYLALDKRLDWDFVVLVLSFIPAGVAIAAFIKLGSWVFTTP
jgi:hypothetical protein